MSQVQADGGEQQRKRNGQRNDNGAANVPQKQEQNDDDQGHAFGKIVQHRVRGVVNQIVAVQIRNDLYAGRKDVLIQPLHHGVKIFQHGGRVGALAQKDDALDHIVVVHHRPVRAMDRFADLAETNLRTLGHLRDVLHPQRRAILRLDDGLLDVLDALDQADGAHIDLLRALLNEASTGVGVAVRQLLLDLRQA